MVGWVVRSWCTSTLPRPELIWRQMCGPSPRLGSLELVVHPSRSRSLAPPAPRSRCAWFTGLNADDPPAMIYSRLIHRTRLGPIATQPARAQGPGTHGERGKGRASFPLPAGVPNLQCPPPLPPWIQPLLPACRTSSSLSSLPILSFDRFILLQTKGHKDYSTTIAVATLFVQRFTLCSSIVNWIEGNKRHATSRTSWNYENKHPVRSR